MKSNVVRVVMVLLWAAVAVVIAVLAISYFRFISTAVYDEAASHLSEVYSQVDRNFDAFMDRNWDNLYDWEDADRMLTDDEIRDATAERKTLWGFTSFFFLDREGNALTPAGERTAYELGDDARLLFDQGEKIMRNETLSDRSEVTLFAIPVASASYGGFSYEALGITYTNADMVAALNTNAFEGESTCFVVKPDGTVILTTEQGASVFTNYLAYLNAGSNLSSEAIDELALAWVDGRSGVLRLDLNGQGYFLSYQPTGYQDLILVGIVPESLTSGSLVEIQKATTDVLVKCFVLVAIVGVIQIFVYYRRHAKRSARMLNYRDTVFERLAENIDDIILMLDGDTWKVDYLSPNVERLLGVPTEEVAKNINVLNKTLYDEDAIIPAEEFKSMPLDRPIVYERRHIHQKTGEMRWYRESVYHQHIDGVEKYIIFMSDRTDEHKMNQNLQEALDTAKNANEAKSRFLSNMSHDIRTPMNAIMGFTGLLAQNTDNPELVDQYVRKIASSSKHLLSLINDVLDMSKIESGKTSINNQQFSFQEAMDELYSIIAPMAEAKHQTLEFRVIGHPSELMTGDPLRVNQILINLLSNAVKYTPNNGRVTFTVEEMPKSSLFREDLRFIVEDNGVGMSPEFLTTIFDPFTREVNSTTNKVQGTGLGMAITKNLVDLMGGVISIDSEPRLGTKVTVDLSFGMPEDFADPAFWTDRSIDRVLVVDDDEDTCLAVQSLMKDTGVEVQYALNGREAVEAATAAAEAGEPFSLIILDWKMPEMDGVECARLIRERLTHEVSILVLTAYDWAHVEEEARAAGIDGFIAKPFYVTSLQQALVAIESDEAQAPADEVPDDILKGLHLLAAEDNRLNAELLRDRLEFEGATVDIVSNGEEAVAKFRTMKPGDYDLMLMDGEMPIMDGYEATRQIRQLDNPVARKMPIIALTANVFAEDVQAALDAGMDAHLGKPLDMDELKRLAERLLKNRPQSAAAAYNDDENDDGDS